MSYLVNSYCYESISEASNAVYSHYILPFGVVQSVTSSGSVLTVNFIYLSGIQTKTGSFNYTLASCTKLGFDSSFSGLTAADSTLIAGSIVSVLIAAWVAKVVRRML